MFDETEVRKTISILKPNNQLFEVRIISGRWNASGYFTDADTLISELNRYRFHENSNIYITLNDVKPECYSRKQRDKLVDNASPTTSDSEIQGFDRLMIDFDPKRAAGTSSSDEQVKKAQARSARVYRYLQDNGWSDPIVAMSGNGYHLLYRIFLENTPEKAELLKNTLAALDMFFGDDEIGIDLKTYNPARVCKLYGTMACKGADTPERPHRMSRIVYAPDEIKVNDAELLKRLAALLPEETKPEKYNGYDPKGFDLEEWIHKHGLHVSSKSAWRGGTKWILSECPFDSSHKGKDASIIQTADGKICFNCFHNSCADKHWKELREKFEPDAYAPRFDCTPKPNYKNPDYVIETKAEQEGDGEKPVFYTTEQIRLLKTPEEEFIKTGVTVIDKKLRGLKKGFVTCLSGLRACGKSSIISQIAVESAQQGYRTAMFSGELTAKNTYKWLMLQSAGRNNTAATRYENYFTVMAEAEERISKWLDGRIYIYNNDYGNNFDEIVTRLYRCVVEHKVDLIILDNLMALNIGMLDRDLYRQQSLFVEHLENFAKQCNIHIVFVAHPRKSDGFLRLDDVSGSNDIVNRVDNAFILHRVNNDFIRLSQQMFKWKNDNELYRCSNVIEICKDRETGVQDLFIPLWFEPESKRLKNDRYENKRYGWEGSELPGFTECDAEIPQEWQGEL